MKISQHVYLFCLVTTLWTFFFLGGLWSDYYQKWHWLLQLLIIFCLPVAVLIYRAPAMVRAFGCAKSMQCSIILAFYFSIPLVVYDFIYLRLFKELSFLYLIDYWYLTLFSVTPWIIFPIAFRWIRK